MTPCMNACFQMPDPAFDPTPPATGTARQRRVPRRGPHGANCVCSDGRCQALRGMLGRPNLMAVRMR